MKTYDKIWQAALNKIKIRAMSIFELRQKLMAKFSNEEGLIIKVIEEMERVELLNDHRFTEQFVEHLIQKPIGRLKIMIKTRQKGLDEELVEKTLLNLNWNEEKSAQRALAEKERTISESDPRKRKMKLMNFLRNRGFRDAVIYKAVSG